MDNRRGRGVVPRQARAGELGTDRSDPEKFPYLAGATLENINATDIGVLVSAMGVLPAVARTPIETDLTEIKDLDEFRGALNQLKDACRLSLRDIERRSSAVAGPLAPEGRKGREPDTTTLSKSVISDMLNGRSSLIPRTVNIYLSACGLGQDEIGTWLKVLYRLRAEETRVAAARRVLLEATGDVGAFVQALDQITGTKTVWDTPAPVSSPPAEPQTGDRPISVVPSQWQPDQPGRHRRESTIRTLIRRLGWRTGTSDPHG